MARLLQLDGIRALLARGVMDYYRMQNIQSDTRMRQSISGEDVSKSVRPASMVKLADSSGLIWVIILVMVSLAKGWSKLQQSKESNSPESDDAPPPAPPKPPVSRPQPRPAPAPMPRVPRAAPPAMRRPTPRSAPVPTPAARKVSLDDIRRVVEKMGRKPQPAAPPPLPSHSVPASPVAMAEPAPPPPLPAPLEAPVQKQTIADAPAPRNHRARHSGPKHSATARTSGTSLLPTKSSVRPGPNWSSGSRNATSFHPIPSPKTGISSAPYGKCMKSSNTQP